MAYDMAKEEKFIMANGCALRLSDTLEGERVIILLHGYLEALDIWDEFTGLFVDKARVVAVDLPGHGVSEVKGEIHTMEFLADTVHAVMQSLGIERAVVVGHSMGGYVALEMLRKYPEALAGIVLFHSSPEADSEKKREDRLREVNLILGGKKELIARSFPHVGFAPQNRTSLAWAIDELSEQIAMTEDEGIVALLRGMRERRDLSQVMREGRVPEMIILGRHDEYITPEAGAKMAAEQPQARVVWLENSGHMGFIEEPQASADAILSFLDTVYGDSTQK